ncbi:MAG: hypothetical protein ACO1OB_31185 [Archangium sp.]
MLGLFSLRGPPLETVDWVGGAIFTALSWAGFGFAVRAAVRVWRGGSSVTHFIAWFSPVLLLGGAIGGAWAAFSIQRGHEHGVEESAKSAWCDRPLFVGHPSREACELAAIECLHLAWQGATLDDGIAERLQATFITRRQQAEREATRRSKADGYYDGADVRVLDRLLEALTPNARRPNHTRVQHAALACLVTRGS